MAEFQYVVARKVGPIILTQVCVSAAVGLNLTVASLAAVEVTGQEAFGGLSQTSIIIGATMLTLVATRLTAHAGRLASLRCTIALAVIGSLVCSVATFLEGKAGWLLFLGLFLLGGGTVSALTSRFLAADKVETDRAKTSAIGLVLTGSALGSAIGPNIYGFLSARTSSAMPFVFIGSALVFALGLVPLAWERCENYSPKLKSSSRTDRRIVWNLSYTVVFAIAIVAHSAMVSLMTMAPMYTDHLYGPAGSGIVMTAHLLGMYAFSPLVSFLFNQAGSKTTVTVGLVIFVGSIGLLIFLHDSLVFFAIGLLGVGLGWSVGMITSSSLISKVSNPSQRIALQGRLDTSINIAAGVSSICSGFAVARFGYPTLASGIFLLICVATLILIFLQRANLSKG